MRYLGYAVAFIGLVILITAALLVIGCHHESPEDKQSYELMTVQFQRWADAAARGEKVSPGFGVMAENYCFQARRDQGTVEAARPLAKACDAFLDRIKAASAR